MQDASFSFVSFLLACLRRLLRQPPQPLVVAARQPARRIARLPVGGVAVAAPQQAG